jgi:hypothetical protein
LHLHVEWQGYNPATPSAVAKAMYSPMAVPEYFHTCFERLLFVFIKGLLLFEFHCSIEKIKQ